MASLAREPAVVFFISGGMSIALHLAPPTGNKEKYGKWLASKLRLLRQMI